MSNKQFIDLVNGQLVFADPLKVTDSLAPTVNVKKTASGINVVRWGVRQLVNSRLGTPGCADNCLTKPFARRYEFQASSNLPTTEAEAAEILKELKQFIADVEVLITNKIYYGAKPTTGTTFPDVNI